MSLRSKLRVVFDFAISHSHLHSVSKSWGLALEELEVDPFSPPPYHDPGQPHFRSP